MMCRTFIALALVLSVGCTAEQIQSDFDAHVEAHNACEVDEDCAVAYPGCPLGCWVAVRADSAEETEEYADELIGRYEAGGGNCEYDCAAHGSPYCDAENRCAADPLE